MSDEATRGSPRALAIAFIALAISFVFVRFPPWPPFETGLDPVPWEPTSLLFRYWWAFTGAAVALAIAAWMGRLGRRGWPAVAGIVAATLLVAGYSAYHYYCQFIVLLQGS